MFHKAYKFRMYPNKEQELLINNKSINANLNILERGMELYLKKEYKVLKVIS